MGNDVSHKMMNFTIIIRFKTLNETISFVKSWLYNTERFERFDNVDSALLNHINKSGVPDNVDSALLNHINKSGDPDNVDSALLILNITPLHSLRLHWTIQNILIAANPTTAFLQKASWPGKIISVK